MSDLATLCCAFFGVLLIGSNKLKRSDVRPVRLSSTAAVFLLLMLMVAAVQIGPYLGLDRAARVDVALGTLLGAALGAVTDSLWSAIYEATENSSLAMLPLPLLMLAVSLQVIVTPLSDDADGLSVHGILAYVIGWVVSMVATWVSNRRVWSSDEPLRLSGLGCVVAAGVAVVTSFLVVSLNLLDLSSAEWTRFFVFALIGVMLGTFAETAGWRTRCSPVALVVATVLSLVATSGVGQNLIPGSGANVSRAVELAGLIVGVSFNMMIDRGIINKYRQKLQ